MKSREKILFVEEMNESLANALRRSASEISVLAVDEVEFYKNDSVLNDQVLAHRIGLVSLKNEKLSMREDCSCEGKGCQKCMIQLKISVEGPKTVYAKDLKGKVDVVYEDTPLAILDEDQKLEFVAYARLGKGIEHAKFSPGLVFYRHVYNIKGKQEKVNEIIEKYKQRIPFMEKESDGYVGDFPEACLKELEGIEGVNIEPGSSLVFMVESFGQIDSKEIFLESIEVLRDLLKKLGKE